MPNKNTVRQWADLLVCAFVSLVLAFWRHRWAVMLGPLLAGIVSCSPQQRLARLLDKHPELAAKEGVTAENAPQLAFYVQGSRVGDYRGPWNKPDVERKIDEILNGYLQRIGKDWLPKVHGMERERGQEIIPVLPADRRPKS